MMLNHRPVHFGASLGAGQAVSALFASQVIDTAPDCLNPSLQLNVALLPWLLPSLRDTLPLAGAVAWVPVHCVRVQLPLGLSPTQVMVPLYPVRHAHAGPATLFEFATVHSTAATTLRGSVCKHIYICCTVRACRRLRNTITDLRTSEPHSGLAKPCQRSSRRK